MAKLLEDLGKELLREALVPVPKHVVITSPEEGREKFSNFSGAVTLKALVPVGKRGKAGAIKFADNLDELQRNIKELLNMILGFYPVERILMEEKVAIKDEFYLSFSINREKQVPVLIASCQGGVDVEEASRESPKQIVTHFIDPLQGLADFKAREIWAGLGITGNVLPKLGMVTSQLYKVFTKYDAYLLEINPLVVTDAGKIMAVDCVMNVDDSAMFRQPAISRRIQLGTERAWRPLTELEKAAVAVNEAEPYRGTARYTEMDVGDIGFMCGGGGASLLLFDALRSCGLEPANYSEFGGNPSEEKVFGLAKVILSKPEIKGLFVAQNITNNTQVDIVAQGVIRAVQELKIQPDSFPIVVREAGVNEEIARRLFQAAGIEYYGDEITLGEAAKCMAEKIMAVKSGNKE